MFPHTVTIYNQYLGKNRLNHWQRTVLSGVFWDSTKGISIGKGNLTSDDEATVRIPVQVRCKGRQYISPKVFAGLEDKTGYWTLSPEDRMVYGDIPFVVDDEHRISMLEQQYDDVLTITKVNYLCYGGHLAHWEVGGK